jgi:hypothetical protein
LFKKLASTFSHAVSSQTPRCIFEMGERGERKFVVTESKEET